MVSFANAPDGPGRVTVWHPYLRGPAPRLQQDLKAGQRSLSFSAKLRPPPPAMAMDY
jgi:hypothetical protein